MSFWSKFGKIASFAAPLVAAPFTGGLSLAALAGKIAPQAIGALANKGQPQMSTPPYVGNGSAGSTGSQIADMITRAGGLAGGVDTALHNGLTPMDRSRAAGAKESALLKQRFDTANLTPAAVGADRVAFGNMMRAANIANYAPNAHAQELWTKYGQHDLTPTAPAMQFSRTMQDELNRRATAGQPMTMSGVAPASAEDVAAGNDAAKLAQGPGGVVGGMQTAGRLASLVPGVMDMFKQKWGQQGSTPTDRNTFVGPVEEDNTYGDFS